MIIPLVSWESGTIIIGVFVVVCIVLVGIVVAMVSGGKKKE